MNNELPEDYEDALTRLEKPPKERVYNPIADSLSNLTDIRIRLALARVIEAGASYASVQTFLLFLNKHLSHDDFAYYTTTIPLLEVTKFRKLLSDHFELGENKKEKMYLWQYL